MASLKELVAEAEARFEKIARHEIHDLPATEHSDGELAYALAKQAKPEAEAAPADATQESE